MAIFPVGSNYLPEAIGTNKLPNRQINGSSYMEDFAVERKIGWEAGIRTPIGGSRVRSLTVRRPPKETTSNLRNSDIQVKPTGERPSRYELHKQILLALRSIDQQNSLARGASPYTVP